MPLASVMKIMIAVEFIRQIRSGRISPDQTVALEDLERYYIPHSDGGSHKNWLREIHQGKQEQRKSVTLQEVAEGMTKYSSNANTEYLMDVLGLEAVNRTVDEICGSEHDPIFPISSAGLVGTYLMDKEHMKLQAVRQRLADMDAEEYQALAKEVHQKLSEGDHKRFIERYNNRTSFDRELQLIESRNMPACTTRLYAELLERLEQLEWFDEEARQQLEHLMGRKVREGSPFVQLLYKGGSSIAISNDVMYVKDRTGNRYSLALFIHDPSGGLKWTKKNQSLFVQRLFTDPSYRSQVAQELKG
ncbi:serine hydrolase [Insulibacter thermoxylanivorax]|uniref:serine hydrolase n=1 Tax=Insulibacter thermoxylanivorax TaxID=2749268 RepID=UPI0023EEA730|nr:serine hydrolase [Insulibacter thermoxylanivorax]